MSSRPLKVLLAIEERASLRHCSKLLSVFGYRVRGTACFAQAARCLAASEPDILIVAAADNIDPALALCRDARGGSPARHLYKVLLVPNTRPTELVKAIEAGIDDLVALPADNGELLSRLRTAARMIEFERRATRHAIRDEATGLLRKQAFLARLQTELTGGKRPVSCVVAQLDDYSELQALHGLPAAAAVLSQLVERVGKRCGPQHALALLEEQRLAALVAGAEDAVAWAAALRASVADAEFKLGEQRVSLSISVGVAIAGPAAGAVELLQKAEQALGLCSNRGAITCRGTPTSWPMRSNGPSWRPPARCWKRRSFATSWSPARSWCGRTTRCTRWKPCFVRRSFARCRSWTTKESWPGWSSADSVRDWARVLDAPEQTVELIMTRDIASFDEQTTLAAVVDYFTQEEPPVIVIVNKGRPTGLVTPNSLATLAQRLTTDTFAPTANARGSAGLRVPNLCGVDLDGSVSA